MISFSEVDTQPSARRGYRRVTKAVEVSFSGRVVLVIPAGYEFDGMSLPKWQLTWDDPWHYRYVAAALLHDYSLGDCPGWSKWYCDWMFEGALRSQGVSALETWVFTTAVRTRRRR